MLLHDLKKKMTIMAYKGFKKSNFQLLKKKCTRTRESTQNSGTHPTIRHRRVINIHPFFYKHSVHLTQPQL